MSEPRSWILSAQERIGYSFTREELLLEALTHPSAVKEGRSHGPDNQRLEYLGDAVLQLAVSHMLLEMSWK